MSDDSTLPPDRPAEAVASGAADGTPTEPLESEGRERAPEPELAGLEDATSPESSVEEPPTEESAAALLTDALEVGPGATVVEADGVEGEPAEDEPAEDEGAEDVERLESPYDRPGQWYVVHTYGG